MLALICGAVAILLNDSRIAIHRSASSELASLSAILSQDIARTIDIYDLSIKGAAGDFHLPNITTVPADLRRMVLFDHAAAGPYLGPIRVLDAEGHVVISSRNEDLPATDFAEDACFKARQVSSWGDRYASIPVTEWQSS